MKKAVKSFEEFINENYNSSQYGSVLLEANTAALKEFSTKKFQTISEVQSFLKKYGTKAVDGKGGFKELAVTGKLDQDTICAFWTFYYGTKSMIPKGGKSPERKNEAQLLQKMGYKSTEKSRIGWYIMKRTYELVQKKNGVNPIPPYPAPKDIIGTKSYYVFREKDFKNRSENKKTPPDYYLNYGNKYCKAFSEKTRPKLSAQGKTWLDKTLIALQEAIEKKLKTDPKIELDSTKFRKYAFDSHPDCYLKSGLLKLPADDLVEIGFTPEFKEFFKLETIMQIIEIIKKTKPSEAKAIAKSALNLVWDATKGQFVKSKKTVAKALTDWYEDAKDTGKKVTKKTAEFISWLTECEEQARLEGYPSLNS
jgi:hypothetical protein